MSQQSTPSEPDELAIDLPDGHPKDWPEETKREVLEAVSEMDIPSAEYARRMLQSLDADSDSDAPVSSGRSG